MPTRRQRHLHVSDLPPAVQREHSAMTETELCAILVALALLAGVIYWYNRGAR